MDQAALEFVLDLQDRASDGLRAFDRVLAGVGGAIPDITGAVDIVTAGAEGSLDRVAAAGDTLEPALTAAGAAAGAGLENGIVSGTAGVVGAVGTVGEQAGTRLSGGIEDATGGIPDQLGDTGEAGGDALGAGTESGFSRHKGAIIAAGAAIGLAAGAAIGASIAGSLDIETANAKLTAQLGLTADESARYGQLAGSLYSSNYGGSLEEVNGAIANVTTAIGGISEASDADLQAATANALNLASTFDIDVASAATAAGIAVKTGLADNATQAFDLITAAAQQVGPQMVDPLLEAANEYGTTFAALGFSGDQAFGTLAVAAEGGEIALDKAGDAMKEFALRATDITDTGAQEALANLGLSGSDMANRILAGGDVAAGATKEIVDGLLQIKDPGEQAAAAIALFGTPLEDIGKDKIPSFLAALSDGTTSLGEVEGAAAKMDATLGGTTAAGIEALKRQFQAAFSEEIGSRALPVLQTLLGFFQQFSGPLLVVASVLGGLAVVVGVISAATAVWAAAQSALAIATGVASGATALFNAVLALNPAVLIAVAIIALVAALIYFFTQTEAGQAIVAAAWAGIKSAVSAVGDWFTGTLVPALSGAWETIKSGVSALRDGVSAIWSAIRDFVVGVVAALITAVVERWTALRTATSAAFDAVRSAVTSALEALRSFVVGIVVAYITAVTGAWDKIKSATSSAWDAVKSVVSDALGALQSAVSGGLDRVVSTARELPGKITGALAGIAATVLVIGTNIITGIVSGITGAYGRVTTAAGDIIGRVQSALSGIAGSVRSIGGDIIDGIVSGVSGGIGRLTSAVKNAATNALNAAKSALGIASPSKVFRDQVGAQVAAGMAVGISREAWRAEDAAAAMAANVTAAGSVKSGAVMSASGGASYASTTSSAPPLVVYVENPWTGDQVRATVASVADERVGAAAGAATIASRQDGRGKGTGL